MTHIPSVVQAYAHLAETVVACRQKMGIYKTRWEIESEGIRVRVEAADGTVNTRFTPWEHMIDNPGNMAFDAGICAGELFKMIKDREAERQPEEDAPIGGAPA